MKINKKTIMMGLGLLLTLIGGAIELSITEMDVEETVDERLAELGLIDKDKENNNGRIN